MAAPQDAVDPPLRYPTCILSVDPNPSLERFGHGPVAEHIGRNPLEVATECLERWMLEDDVVVSLLEYMDAVGRNFSNRHDGVGRQQCL